jgi:hypothetical protein
MPDVPIVTRHLSREEILGLVQSLDPALAGNARFRVQPAFGGSMETAVLVSLIGEGTAVAVALINGLFLLWSQRLAAERAKSSEKPREKPRERPLVVVRTPRLTINIRSPADLPDEKELGADPLLEIRLDVET